MGNITEERTSESSLDGVEGVKERVQDAAEQAKHQTREQLREQIDTRTTEAGEQLSSAAQAIRRASEQLRTEGNARAANLVDTVADRGEQLGSYLTRTDGNGLLQDVEDFTRRQPWLMATAGALAGFLASRFVKASSGNRYQTRVNAGYSTGRPAESQAEYDVSSRQLERPGSPSLAGGGSSGIH